MSEEKKILVCVRAETAALMSAGSTTKHTCARCGQHVLVAQTSQRLLRDEPDQIEIACMQCVAEGIGVGGEDVELRLAGTLEEIVSEAASAVPNLYGRRN